MFFAQQSVPGIEAAIAKLGYPKRTWFRGHVAAHRLLPSLFRFSGAVDREREIINWCQERSGSSRRASIDGLDKLLDMHHRYVPTRLLAWTEYLHIALFCALVRESETPTVFILDPVALNALSNIADVLKSSLLAQASVPEHPIAVERCRNKSGLVDRIFTVHGTNTLPLEEQCPACVMKVVLTQEEIALAKEYVLSGQASTRTRKPPALR